MRSLFAIILFGALLFSGQGCRDKAKDAGSFSLRKDSVKVNSMTLFKQVGGYGRLEAISAENLIVRFNGNIKLNGQGTTFKKGQLIYRLTGQDIELQKMKLENALSKAKARFDYEESVYSRKKKLIENKVLPRKERDKIIYNFTAAKENLKQAETRRRYFLNMTAFKAPFDGFLSNLSVNQGEYVQKGRSIGLFSSNSGFKLIGTSYGDTLFSIESEPLVIELNGVFQTGGRIMFVEKTINPTSGGHTFWAMLNSVSNGLYSGSYVRYALKFDPYQAPVVPKTALVLEKGKFYVVQSVGGKYRNVAVTVGRRVNDLVEIKEGLKPGAVVLTRGAFEIFHRNLQKTLKLAD